MPDAGCRRQQHAEGRHEITQVGADGSRTRSEEKSAGSLPEMRTEEQHQGRERQDVAKA